MVKSVNIISSLMGAGLHREALLLKDLLATRGITVRLMHYTDGANAPMERADINIFLEVVMPQALALAPQNWLAPNCEWWVPQNEQYLPHFSKILCKTLDCQRIWSAKIGADRCVYTSFEARDLYKPEIPRENRFLHVAGKSGNKGTKAVIQAWQMIPNSLPPLTVVASNPEYQKQFELNRSNIDFRTKVTEDELVRLMNSHKFHIAPSPYEGFGHSIHEGAGCGAFVFVTNAPPFTAPDHETKGTYTGLFPLVPVDSTMKVRLATMSLVHAAGVRNICVSAFNNFKDCDRCSGARTWFLENNEFARKTFLSLVESA
jgi:glycosyltransferase involved in cell wall biosynthesis